MAGIVLATAAVAHTGVQNPAVQARMKSMEMIAGDLKVIGEMAKGARPVDADAAAATAKRIASHAARTPELFAARETDPKSEARATIWEEFDRFAALSAELEAAALASLPIASRDDAVGALRAMGATCKACHEDYRD